MENYRVKINCGTVGASGIVTPKKEVIFDEIVTDFQNLAAKAMLLTEKAEEQLRCIAVLPEPTDEIPKNEVKPEAWPDAFECLRRLGWQINEALERIQDLLDRVQV